MGLDVPALFEGGASCSVICARPFPLSGGGGPIEKPGRFSSSKSSSSSAFLLNAASDYPPVKKTLTCLYKLRVSCERCACPSRVHGSRVSVPASPWSSKVCHAECVTRVQNMSRVVTIFQIRKTDASSILNTQRSASIMVRSKPLMSMFSPANYRRVTLRLSIPQQKGRIRIKTNPKTSNNHKRRNGNHLFQLASVKRKDAVPLLHQNFLLCFRRRVAVSSSLRWSA
jgi:hypothetical protein